MSDVEKDVKDTKGKEIAVVIEQTIKVPLISCGHQQKEKIFINLEKDTYTAYLISNPYNIPDIPWITIVGLTKEQEIIIVGQSREAWEKNYPDGAVRIIEE